MDELEMTIEEALSEVNNNKELTDYKRKKYKKALKQAGFAYVDKKIGWAYQDEGEPPLQELLSDYEEKTTTNKNAKVQTSTQENENFTQEEIDTLKQLVSERKRNIELFSVYKIYDELSKVPTNAETVRSAYNLSKETTERLKKYANERRLPLQDLVELAVINLLDKYEK